MIKKAIHENKIESLDQVMSWPLVFWEGICSPQTGRSRACRIVHNDISGVRSVLDIGCEPGTDTSHFASTEYLGIDLNERHIQIARRHYARAVTVPARRQKRSLICG